MQGEDGSFPAAKGANVIQTELRRKLAAFPTGGLLFRLITRF
jgi:hypothetical protein